MFSSSNKAKINKNCVYCGNKIKDQFFVLSDQSYIDKECLEMLNLTLVDLQDQDMKQFYNFILSKVVSCNNCNSPLDLLHKDYMTLPLCSKCKPSNIFYQKVQSQICQLCDHQITQQNKLKKPSIVLGIIMCKKCYNLQTGQIEENLQEKPDLREKNKKAEIRSLFNNSPDIKNVDHRKNLQSLSQKLNNIKGGKQEIKPQEVKLPKYEIAKCQQKQDTFGLQGLFGQKQMVFYKVPLIETKNPKQKKIENVIVVNQIKLEVEETTKLEILGQQSHKYSLKECKICFNAQSQMMNKQCRHLMMCQPCYKMMLQRQDKKNQLYCPVCQTLGNLFTYDLKKILSVMYKI